MYDISFDDAALVEYCQKREMELQEDQNENQAIPQYITDLNEQAQQDPDVVYISSDEESETEEPEDNIVIEYVEVPHTRNDEYEVNESDNSYYTCNTHISPPSTELGIDDHIYLLNIDSDSEPVRPITDSNRDSIVIEDHDSEEEFVRTRPLTLRSRTIESVTRLLKRKTDIPEQSMKRQKVQKVASEPRKIKRPKRYLASRLYTLNYHHIVIVYTFIYRMTTLK
ncbi:hypothetical protein EDC94DRAFT_618882 [Helicostylum pulchrum]|nr:hypothetical protein EDC94DRAFT_618882 [Helicostylum pulchrum]